MFSFNCFFKNGPKELEILEALQHFHPKDGRAKNMQIGRYELGAPHTC